MNIIFLSLWRYTAEVWDRACAMNVGCAKYKDLDYVSRIRRWPPSMVAKLKDFLELSAPGGR